MNDIPLSWQLGSLAVLLLISAFFSIAETSLMLLSRYRLRHLASQGHRGALLTTKLLGKTDELLGVILLGNNFANAAAATLMTLISVELLGEGQWVLMVGTVVVTFAILVFSEVSPKMIAAAYPEKLAFACSYILYPLLKLLYPAVWFINLFVRAVISLLGIKVNLDDTSRAISMEELRSIVSEAGGYIPKKHRAILLNLFDLEKMMVDDVMTAHMHVETIDFDAPIEDIIQQISVSHHTRLPVRQGANEEIIGIIHIRRVLDQLRDGNLTLEGLKNVVSEPYFIPLGTSLYTQIQQFQEKQQHIALVVDEYGELKGLVTLEDILEEILGDFSTQSASAVVTYQKMPDESWLVDGMSNLRDLNKSLNLNLPTDGPRTLNGLVVEHFEDIPEPGTSFKLAGYVLEIVETQDQLVKSVRIYPVT
ncbi:MAG: HlyC/CorC family transporter [Methylophilaceae bacterium]